MATLPKPRLSAQDKEWRARDDVRTLREAESIRQDKGRHRLAVAQAKKEVSALNKAIRTAPRRK
jgi:hypothetical protein